MEAIFLSCGYSKDQTSTTNLTFQMKDHEIWGILGANGSGKTTLLRTLAGILPPISGKINLWGSPLNLEKKAEKMAFLPQLLKIPSGFTIQEIVQMGRYPYQKKWGNISKEETELIDHILQKLNLEKTKEGALCSGGEQKRILLAQALAQTPEILFLDEPLAHLDLRYKIEMLKLLKKINKENTALIISFHDLEMSAYFCHKILLLTKESFYMGSPKEVLTSKNIFSAFEMEAHLSFEGKIPKLFYQF